MSLVNKIAETLAIGSLLETLHCQGCEEYAAKAPRDGGQEEDIRLDFPAPAEVAVEPESCNPERWYAQNPNFVQPLVDLTEYPEFFVTTTAQGDYHFEGYLVVGERSPGSDNVAITDIAVGMRVYRNGEEVPVEIVPHAVKVDYEIEDPFAQNIIVVGSPCENDIAAQLVDPACGCTDPLRPGQAEVRLFEFYTGNLALLVRGATHENTRAAGRILGHTPEAVTEAGGTTVIIDVSN